MDIPWDDVRLFLAVAEGGSVSGAARRLRLGQPTVSRRLAELEYRLGTALFRRSVAGATLTPAGERLVEPARRMAEWAGEVGRVAERRDQAPTGLVRVTASPVAAHEFLAPFAAWLGQRHPGLRLEVISSMAYLDLGRGEADLALRLRGPDSADLAILESIEFPQAVFVARSLRARLPRKVRLEQLPWIAWAPPYEDLPPNPQLRAAIPDFKPAFAADNLLVMLAAAEAGAGAIVRARLRHRFTRPTSLVPLPLDLGAFARASLQLVAARSAVEVPRIRVVAELLGAELRRMRGG